MSTEIAAQLDAEPDVTIIRKNLVSWVIDASHISEGKEAAVMAALAAFYKAFVRIDMQVQNTQDIKDHVGNCFTLHLKCVHTKQEVDIVIIIFSKSKQITEIWSPGMLPCIKQQRTSINLGTIIGILCTCEYVDM